MHLDKYRISQQEKTQVKELGQEIAEMPLFEIPSTARTLKDLAENAQTTIERLDEIYWEQIAEMQIGEIYIEVNPIGGFEKADAIKESRQRAERDSSRRHVCR